MGRLMCWSSKLKTVVGVVGRCCLMGPSSNEDYYLDHFKKILIDWLIDWLGQWGHARLTLLLLLVQSLLLDSWLSMAGVNNLMHKAYQIPITSPHTTHICWIRSVHAYTILDTLLSCLGDVQWATPRVKNTRYISVMPWPWGYAMGHASSEASELVCLRSAPTLTIDCRPICLQFCFTGSFFPQQLNVRPNPQKEDLHKLLE